jgi:uncharacterized protein YjdB
MKYRLISLMFAVLSLTACGGGGLTHLFGLPAIPTPSPAPAISVTPTSVTVGVGKTATVTASENSANAYFTAQSSDTTVATVAQGTSPNAFVVTGVKSGKCNLLIADSYGTTVTVSVAVQ